MKKIAILIAMAAMVALSVNATAEEPKPIKLLKPRMEGGKPLMQALSERKSTREYDTKELPLQVLSDMLWAACGINRPESGLRTNPTAKNMQEIDLYVALKDGIYLYDFKENVLLPVISGDRRADTGSQPFVKEAPVNLIFVADYAKMGGMDKAGMDLYAATDTGNISQNVYLFCASEGLATVVRGWVDRASLAKVMGLPPAKKVILTQTVGYPVVK